METRSLKRAREQLQGVADAAAHQPAAHDTAAVHEGGSQQPCSDDPPTHILSLPHHLIASLILPRVSSAKDCRAFLGTCKAARSMSSTHTQAKWLQWNRPATALYLAATSESGSDALMLELLNRPGMLEAMPAKDQSGDPLLVCASRAGYSQAVRVLLQRGLDPNTANTYGFTPLMAAASGGHASVVETLLQDGKQVNVGQTDVFACTALHEGARYGHASVVRMLIQAGAPVNARLSNFQGFTPLHLACYFMPDPDVVRELLRHPDVNTELHGQISTVDPTGTPLALACHEGHDEVVAMLEQHAMR